MAWNWEHKDWPVFKYGADELQESEFRFFKEVGHFEGVCSRLTDYDLSSLTVQLLEDEAYKTSEIEGETLDRDSLRSSLRRNFGLQTDGKHPEPAEYGISEMATDLYRNYASPLDERTMNSWHHMLTHFRRDISAIGRYRDHDDPMQVVSGYEGNLHVHFIAPPSPQVRSEMDRFIEWFNDTGPGGSRPLPALTRAGLAHLHFVSIHPYEDGNGRIARALAEKAIYQNTGTPTLLALSHTIQETKTEYYRQLEMTQRGGMSASNWLKFFNETAISAQQYSQRLVEFTLDKTQLYEQARSLGINGRQQKAMDRIVRAGLEGFTGGMSAKNYMTITDATQPTATRDLKEMVDHGLFFRTGEKKGTRYWLNAPSLYHDKGSAPASTHQLNQSTGHNSELNTKIDKFVDNTETLWVERNSLEASASKNHCAIMELPRYQDWDRLRQTVFLQGKEILEGYDKYRDTLSTRGYTEEAVQETMNKASVVMRSDRHEQALTMTRSDDPVTAAKGNAYLYREASQQGDTEMARIRMDGAMRGYQALEKAGDKAGLHRLTQDPNFSTLLDHAKPYGHVQSQSPGFEM